MIRQNFPISDNQLCSMFVVIDGHGGPQCADFLVEHLIPTLKSLFVTQVKEVDYSSNINETIHSIFVKAYAQLDQAFYEKDPVVAMNCGATCLILMILGSKIYTINLGDSRAIMSKKGQVIELTQDHKPDRE